jgi:uncharacterized protein (TIGR02246 family)
MDCNNSIARILLLLIGFGGTTLVAYTAAQPTNSEQSTPAINLIMQPSSQTPTSDRSDEAAIREVVKTRQNGQNIRNGKLFASGFANDHDYIVINGMFRPNLTQEDNARSHQVLYDGARSSLGGNLGEVEVQFSVAKIRFLTPEIAVMHIHSRAGPRNQPDKRANNIISTMMQKQAGEWKIVAFHNAPVQKSEKDNFGFVIELESLEKPPQWRTQDNPKINALGRFSMKNLSIGDKLIIAVIWGSAVCMTGIAGVFGRGNPIALAAAPMAAGATTVALVNSSKRFKDKADVEKTLLGQAEHVKMLETRLENLELIVTQDEYLLLKQSQTAMRE